MTRSMLMAAMAIALAGVAPGASEWQNDTSAAVPPDKAVVDQYCLGCHNARVKSGGLVLEGLDVTRVADHRDVWEKVVRKMRAGVMPPVGMPRPQPAAYDAFRTRLEGALDRAAAGAPDPGRTEAMHRLNRAEYHNAVRDLLALDVDVADLLPSDDASYGFDNIAGVLKVSQSLMERYLMAARKIARLAIGVPAAPTAETFRLPTDGAQYAQVEGLPFGTRGGARVPFNFPMDAEYSVEVEFSGGAPAGSETMEVTIDGERVTTFPVTVATPRSTERTIGTRGFTYRIPVKAGPHSLGVTFVQNTTSYVEGQRQRFMKPRIYDLGGAMPMVAPFISSVTINGPFEITGPGDTPSRRRVLMCRPATAGEELPCAKRILSTLARRAYRRPVTDADLARLLPFYTDARKDEGFDGAVALALRRLLVAPEFLFRVEHDPAGSANAAYRINDLELASRLSFFLWSSIPDDELLELAVRGRLSDPAVLERQTKRMLADARSDALVKSFLHQWLYLRNVPSLAPADDLFPDFDASLRPSFQRETELLFDHIMRDDRSALELLTADYTFVNERLARHYGIPNVLGSHFRRVALTDDRRHGLLGQGSILAVTSRPNRTSPVLRGKWILENVLGTPPPPPPANVPPLDEQKDGIHKVLTMRERMAQHRANPVCASCHSMIDPIGFSLENFDAIGRWRDVDEGFAPIDAVGSLPDGTKFDGINGLRQALVAHPDRFVTAMSEKLLIYALGRGVEDYDAPALRRIVRDAAASNYKFSSIVVGIVNSLPFQMRRSATS